MSLMVAGEPPLVISALSPTLKTRDLVLPAMVNVFAV